MKFKELEYSRTFNIGNYESEKVTLKADIEDVETQDEFDDSFKTLKSQVFWLHSLKEKEEPEEKEYYNPENIDWVRTEGQKGVYERYPAFQQKPRQTKDYLNLLKDLRKHDETMVHSGLFYWLFEDDTTIGRKPAKQ